MSSKNKKVKHVILIELPAQTVTPGPPLATTLGPKGANLGIVAKDFNSLTASYNKGWLVRTRITLYEDKSHDIVLLGYTTRELLFRNLNITKGSVKPGHQIQQINMSKAEVRDILAKIAKDKFPGQDLDKALRTLHGSMKSMGIGLGN